MKVLLLTSNSIQNMALSHMLSKEHELVGIIYENRFSKGNRFFNYIKKVNYNPFRVIEKIYQKFRLKFLEESVLTELNLGYRDFSQFYDVSKIEVSNVNQKESIDFIKNNPHDIIVVSGTRMVRKDVLGLKPTYGIINMHTGLSPYYNGGPSCTFWCLYNNDIEFIGATVMFIDEGIDSGNIILSQTIELDEKDTYGRLEFKAIDLGNKLILKALNKIEKGGSVPSYSQKSIGTGYVFYNRDYTFSKRLSVQKKIRAGLIKKLIVERKFKKDIIRIIE